eukprot:scaffold7831_cov95-Phaeocystis_antarctica.AAC.1
MTNGGTSVEAWVWCVSLLMFCACWCMCIETRFRTLLAGAAPSQTATDAKQGLSPTPTAPTTTTARHLFSGRRLFREEDGKKQSSEAAEADAGGRGEAQPNGVDSRERE